MAALRTVGYDESLYGLHSLRTGGVSQDGYIQDELYNKLLVSWNLDL